MNLIEKSPLIHSFFNYSVYPTQCSDEQDRTGCTGEMNAHLLHTVQLLTSLLAIPLILLVGFSTAAFQACNCERSEAKATLQATMAALTIHSFLMIPYSLVGICSPKELADKSIQPLKGFAEKIAKIWELNCCPSTAKPALHRSLRHPAFSESLLYDYNSESAPLGNRSGPKISAASGFSHRLEQPVSEVAKLEFIIPNDTSTEEDEW